MFAAEKSARARTHSPIRERFESLAVDHALTQSVCSSVNEYEAECLFAEAKQRASESRQHASAVPNAKRLSELSLNRCPNRRIALFAIDHDLKPAKNGREINNLFPTAADIFPTCGAGHASPWRPRVIFARFHRSGHLSSLDDRVWTKSQQARD
jgi:hypothetical protein